MAQGLFQKLTGREGTVKIDTLGAHIGDMQSWTLTRRGERGPTEGLFDLHAVFSYLNNHLFEHPEYAAKRRIRVRIGKRQLLLVETEHTTVSIEGKQLILNAVSLSEGN